MTNKPSWQGELRDRMLEAADLGGDIYCVKAVDIATAFIQDLLDRKAREIEKLKIDPRTVVVGNIQFIGGNNSAIDQALSILKEE